MIKNVIFDVANVIVDWNPRFALPGISEADIERFLTSKAFAKLNHETDAGLSLAQAQARFDADAPDLAEIYRTYLTNFADTVPGPMPGTSGVIKELLASGVPTYGLSNWASENFHVARAAAPVLGELTGLVVSGDVGLAKPDPAIFELVIQRFGLVAGQTVMIDDRVENLRAARSVGLATIHFTDADVLRADLARIHLLPS